MPVLAVCVVVIGRRCWVVAVRVVETGCRVLVLGAIPVGAGSGRRKLARRCSVLVPASDSEVITTAASVSEG